MLWTTAAQSVSKNITCTSVRIRGAWVFNIGEAQFPNGGGTQRNSAARRLLVVQLRRDRCDNFSHADRFHTPKIDWAFPQKAGTAFDLMANDAMARSQWSGKAGLRRAEHSHHGNSDKAGEVHGSGVVGE